MMVDEPRATTMAAQRAPTPMTSLRRQADVSRFSTHEYSLRIWLNMAKQAFDASQHKWQLGRPPRGEAKLIEEAYVQLRMGAEFFKLAMANPGYKNISSQDKAYLVQVQSLLKTATSVQPEMVAWLEQREKEWNDRFGALGDRTNRSGGAAAGSNTNSKEANHRGSDSISDMIDGYADRSAASSTFRQFGLGLTTLISITERLANLRASGMTTGTTKPSSIAPSRAPPLTLRHAPVPKPPQTPNFEGFGYDGDSSSTTRKGDLVSDQAVERSGSAPPVLPQSKDQNGPYLGGVVADDEPAPPTSSPGTRLAALPSPSSPSTFHSRFPGLDDFEKSAESEYSFPSVPIFEPGRNSDPGPGGPPRAFDLPDTRRDEPPPLRMSSSSSMPGPAPPRPDLPSALIPGRRAPPPVPSTPSSSVTGRARSGSSASTSSQPPLPPPPPAPSSSSPSAKSFNIPFTTEVTPIALHHYLTQALAETGRGPRVLLLDVRSREDFDRARIRGETVCLEPIVLRNGISSSELESALTLSPTQEQRLFAARHHYDIVIVYDRASTTLPTVAPHSTSSEAQRVLWNLIVAIYEREFQKSLKRQPVLLKGGWEAWEKQVGSKGIQGSHAGAEQNGQRRPSVGSELDKVADAKKANRKASIVTNMGGNTVMRNGSGAYSTSTSSPPSTNGYFGVPPSTFSSATYPSSPGVGSGMISPRLAMPPQAAQPSSARPSFDSGYANSGFSTSVTTAYSPHPPQPHLNGLSSSQTWSYPTPSTDGSPTMTRTRGDYGDLHAHGAHSFTPRPSIDYPQLQSRALPNAPPINSVARAPAPALPPVPLTRPPAVRAAPQRSNSSFTGISVNSYSSSHSNFPSHFSFDDNAIGLTGLKNLGNTCYMNSTIQCLSATIPFARYFKDRSYRRDVNVTNPLGTRGALADAVSELIRAIWAQQYIFLSPVTFRENICRVAPQFRGSDQHDAQEFLGFLLDGLHEDLNYVTHKPAPVEMSPEREHDLETLPAQIMSEREWEIYRMRNDSFVVQCFQGQFRNQMKCLTCGKTSTTYNTFMPLSIPIPSGRGITKTSLYECIQGFVREEILDKDDAWFCPRCKTNRKATKKLSLSRLPPILVIHLKRFSFHGPFSDKIETQVQYPLSGLDLTPFIPPPLIDPRASNKNGPTKGYVYDLFGVTSHYGNLSSGHYTAYVQSGRDWHNIGDSKVTQVDPRIVESAKSAYILYLALRS